MTWQMLEIKTKAVKLWVKNHLKIGKIDKLTQVR